MPRHLNRLTVLQVARLNKPGLHADGGGLYLQITKAGNKSWLFRYMQDGKAYGMGLGPLHTIGLAEARLKALECRRQRLDGLNPLEVKREKKKAQALEKAKMMTFDQCAQAYIAAHKASWKNPKHQDQWRNSIASYASPVFGEQPVADIDTALIVRALSPIWEPKTETASRLRGRIESILGWATTSGYRTGDNPARWRGHLENLLASIPKSARTRNHPSLEWSQVGAFMQALQLIPGNGSRALEFCILTACRSGEVRGAEWSEIDFDQAIWTIPAIRMKAGREHQVPLSAPALALLRTLQLEQKHGREHGEIKTDLVFLGVKDQMLSDMTLTALIRRMNEADLEQQWLDPAGNRITAHGFRASFRMWAAEATNYPREVAEHALAHQLPDAVERAYQRGTQFKKRVSMMEDWGKLCQSGAKPLQTNRHAGKPND